MYYDVNGDFLYVTCLTNTGLLLYLVASICIWELIIRKILISIKQTYRRLRYGR